MGLTAEDALPAVWIAAALAGAYVLGGLLRGARSFLGRSWRPAWWASGRLMGPYPVLGAALLVGPIVVFGARENSFDLPQLGPVRAAATLVPLVAACHLAFAFSPSDEPALENILAAPRPVQWVFCERLLLTLLPYAALASGASAIAMARFPADGAGTLWRWLPPLIFFAGVSTFTTQASRQPALGMTLTIVVWFSLVFMGPGILLRWPHLWPLLVYFQPELAISQQVFILQQVWIGCAGLALLVRTTRLLDDSEGLLKERAV